MFSRRTFVQRSGKLAGALTAIAAVPAFGQTAGTSGANKVYRFRASGISPPDNPNSIAFKKYLDKLAAASNGRLQFDWHPGAVLVPTNEALDALSQGTIDILYSNPAFYTGKVSIGSFSDLPFYRTGYQEYFDLYYKTDMHSIIDQAYREKVNCTVLQLRPVANYTFIMGRNKTVRTLADLTGKKIRTPGGMADDILKSIGAVPVKLVPGEFYQGLQQGIVDGFLLPLYALETYKLGDLRPSVTQPGTGSLTSQLIWMNLDRWNELPPDLQALFNTQTMADIPPLVDFMKADDEKALAYAKKTNVELVEFSAADRKLMADSTRGVVASFEAKEGDKGKQLVKILQSL